MARLRFRRKHALEVIGLLRAALDPDYVVIGGGNAKKLGRLPDGVRLGGNVNAFAGGFKLWDEAADGGSERERTRKKKQRR